MTTLTKQYIFMLGFSAFIFLMSFKCGASDACNPRTYAKTYIAIIKQGMLEIDRHGLTTEVVNRRNDAIELLRELCRGQKPDILYPRDLDSVQ